MTIAVMLALHLQWAILPDAPLRAPRPVVRDMTKGERNWSKFFPNAWRA